MTATVLDFAPLPAFLGGIERTIAADALRRTALLEVNEEITEARANQRLTRYANKTLTTEARNDAYEQLKDAIQRLSCLEMPHPCACHDYAGEDVDGLILDADGDAEDAIQKLLGGRK
jgi:hypothetical protein